MSILYGFANSVFYECVWRKPSLSVQCTNSQLSGRHDFQKALPGGEWAQEHRCLTAPFGRKLPSNLVKYFAIAAQFFMLFLTLAFLKPYTSSGRTATVVYKVPHNYSEHLGCNNTTLNYCCFVYECVWNRKKMLIIGLDNGSIGRRWDALFVYCWRRVFMQEVWSAEFAWEAQVLAKPRSWVCVSPVPSTSTCFLFLPKHLKAVAWMCFL